MKVVWTSAALADLGNARAYIAEENPRAAVHVAARIEAAVQALRRHPEIGRPGRVDGTRELVIPGTPFIAVNLIQTKRIDLVALIHGARHWPDDP